jgi:HAD superfamily phosphatase (TIGR01668 family)
MLKKFTPTWYSSKVDKINFKYLKEQEIKIIFFDLDNTIANYQEVKADDNMQQLFKNCFALGFKVYLISNNSKEDRVKAFANQLNCDGYLFNAGKPGVSRVLKFISANKLSLQQIVVVGDQLLTDVIMANSLKVKSIAVEPKSTKDLPITRINRIIDKTIRKILKNKGLLIDIGQDIA